ncbi:MAG: DNA polymerase III subunit gamma/tau [Deltaproteobacteria bacterium]|nr:DNA polymerase III subunit gamma/tau [Deltaproteobacteria bacterium]
MVYEVLARKWRPQVFEDVVGQEHIAQTLINAIRADRLAHAYLFSGARGVGKTSVARILAKAVNCTEGEPGIPCNRCNSCKEITAGSSLDVQEIDGASNRGIDDIKELRENIKYMPSSGKFRIYIIDEVHMLTREAFNALLKTLEEPPPHVKFIFATTDPHKVPVTILSRCQRFDFKRIPLGLVTRQLEKIAEREGLEIRKAGLTLIAGKAEGSMRDAESLLDQVVSYTGRKVDEKDIADILGILDRELLFETSLAILEGNSKKCLEIMEKTYDYGYDIREFYRALMDQFRNLLVSLVDPQSETLEMGEDHRREVRRQAEMAGMEKLQQCLNLLIAREEDIRFTSHPRLVLEILMIRLSRLGEWLSFEELIRKLDALERRLTRGEGLSGDSGHGGTALSESPGTWAPAKGAPEPLPSETQDGDWQTFLDFLAPKNGPMANVLKDWRFAGLQGGILRMEKGESSFSSSFLDEPGRLKRLEEYCREFYGRDIRVHFSSGRKNASSGGQPGAAKESARKEKGRTDLPGPVQDILEIFKGEIREEPAVEGSGDRTRSPTGTQRREKP